MIRYSIDSRSPARHIMKAQEIFVREQDYQIIPDLFIKYPNHIIILIADSYFIKYGIATLKRYAECSKNFLTATKSIKDLELLLKENIKCYYYYPIQTWFEVKALDMLGVEYISIDQPLTFQMDRLSNFTTKFRCVVNQAKDNFDSSLNIRTFWIRPEDVELYSKYISVFDFAVDSDEKIFDIYFDGKWSGNLNFLIKDLKRNIDNKFLLATFGEKRLNCNQKCLYSNRCNMCDILYNISKTFHHKREEVQKYGKRSTG